MNLNCVKTIKDIEMGRLVTGAVNPVVLYVSGGNTQVRDEVVTPRFQVSLPLSKSKFTACGSTVNKCNFVD